MKPWMIFLTTLGAVSAASAPISFNDDFSLSGAKPSESWEIVSGAFPVVEGRMTVRADRGNAFAVIREVPELEAFEYSIRVRIPERVNAGGYATGGIMLYQDGANHWRLQFAEGPDKKRYFEMGETLAGVWQAQSSGPNKLRSADVLTTTWDYGREYVMKISLSTNGIHGEISEAEGGKLAARYRYFWDEARAVQLGRPGVTANGLAVSYAAARVTAERSTAAPAGIVLEEGKSGRCAILSVASIAPSGRLATDGRPPVVLSTGLSGSGAARIPLLAKAARSAGFGVTLLSCDEISRPRVLVPDLLDILILPDPRFPATARDALQRYLRNGGHGVFLGGRAFGSLLFPVDGKWMGKQDIERALFEIPAGAPLFDFKAESAPWERSTDKKENPSSAKIENGALRIDIKGYTLWDTFAAPLPRKLDKNALIVLSMKGDAATPQVAVELVEQDGARWIASIDLTPEMKRQVLLPGRFKAWDPKAKAKAGLDMERVVKISFGLASTHTPAVSRGDHAIWVGAIATAENRFGGVDFDADLNLPIFGEDDEGGLQGAVNIRPAPASPFPWGDKLSAPVAGLAAVGFGIPNESVSVPLLEAVDAFGRGRGAAAGMLLHIGGGYRGSAWIFSGITNDSFYKEPAFSPFLAKALLAAKKGDLLRKAREEDRDRPKGLALVTPGPKGFIHIGKDGHFAAPDGKRLFITGANYIGSFATAVRFFQDENFDPRELENNFRMAKAAGINVLRLFHVHGLAADLMRGDRRKLDTILELARRYGIYLLLETSAGLSETGGNMEGVCAILARVGEMLKDEPMIFGYDLRNEPTIGFVAGMNYPKDRKPAVHTTRLIDLYPEEAAEIRKLVETRPAWLRLPTSITGVDAENAIAAIHLWSKYTREFGIGNTTFGALPPTGLPTPAKWDPLVKAVDQSYGLWIQMQKDALRKADPNHLITVGYNLVFAALPCNEKLDFVSHHVYGKPFSLAEVMENVTALDRLKKLFPTQPASLGEFGYTSGIAMPGKGHLDPHTASVGELIHYLYAFANGFEGCKKWMLVDWPIPVMQRFGSWSQHGLDGKRYEARFGFYAYDGTAHGRPKPIAYALKYLRDFADATPPSGGLAISAAPLTIGAGYVYTNRNALFVGNTAYASPRLSFKSTQPANVMLSWGAAGIRAMATTDARVTLDPSAFGPYGQGVEGRHGGVSKDGKRLVIEMHEGETLTIK
jgi:hypothetical protein